MRVYTIGFRNRFTALLALLLVLGIGGALLLVGLALLAGVAAAGAVLGAGVLAYRALRGPRASAPVHRVVDRLDPALEVFPDRAAPNDAHDAQVDSDPGRRLGPG